MLFKEPGGRNLCGCGRTPPPSFTGFFITEGKQGPPQPLPHHHKYGGDVCVCVCAGRNAKREGKENRGGKMIFRKRKKEGGEEKR